MRSPLSVEIGLTDLKKCLDPTPLVFTALKCGYSSHNRMFSLQLKQDSKAFQSIWLRVTKVVADYGSEFSG